MPPVAYCTNVHPSETLDEVLRVIRNHAPAVAQILGAEVLPVGLYLSAQVVAQLMQQPDRLPQLRQELEANGLEVITLNAFPYGGFHADVVKTQVYRPDWRTRKRLDYTLQAVACLSQLAPRSTSRPLTLSTVAGGFKPDMAVAGARRQVIEMLVDAAEGLADFEQQSGRTTILCLEPEPFTMLETTAEVLAFFEELVAAGGERCRRFIGVCYDCCHQAVEFEDAEQSLQMLSDAGIRVGKIQLSNALRVTSAAGLEALGAFDEPRYLHQTFARRADGAVTGFVELGEALGWASQNHWQELRTHFHVPLSFRGDDRLQTTQQDVVRVLDWCRLQAEPPALEVETYTWSVLPQQLAPSGLEAGIAAEIRWVREAMESLQRGG